MICAPYGGLRIGRPSSSRPVAVNLSLVEGNQEKQIRQLKFTVQKLHHCWESTNGKEKKKVRIHCPRELFKLKVFGSHVLAKILLTASCFRISASLLIKEWKLWIEPSWSYQSINPGTQQPPESFLQVIELKIYFPSFLSLSAGS